MNDYSLKQLLIQQNNQALIITNNLFFFRLQVNQPSWHIPRASLGSTATSTSGSSQKSHSNEKQSATGHKNRGYQSDDDKAETSRRQRKQRRSGVSAIDVGGRRQINRDIDKNPDGPQTGNETTVGGIKRSSQSSQGSTDSNHSSHVSNNELL